MIGIATHCHHSSYCLIYGAGHHVIGIYPGIGGQQCLGCCQPMEGVEDRTYDNRIAVYVAVFSNKGLDHAGPLDLVVVLPDDPFF